MPTIKLSKKPKTEFQDININHNDYINGNDENNKSETIDKSTVNQDNIINQKFNKIKKFISTNIFKSIIALCLILITFSQIVTSIKTGTNNNVDSNNNNNNNISNGGFNEFKLDFIDHKDVYDIEVYFDSKNNSNDNLFAKMFKGDKKEKQIVPIAPCSSTYLNSALICSSSNSYLNVSYGLEDITNKDSKNNNYYSLLISNNVNVYDVKVSCKCGKIYRFYSLGFDNNISTDKIEEYNERFKKIIDENDPVKKITDHIASSGNDASRITDDGNSIIFNGSGDANNIIGGKNDD